MSMHIFLDAYQLADRWQVSTGHLANQRSQGRGLPYVRIGSRVRYRLSDVEAFESSNVVNPIGALSHSKPV